MARRDARHRRRAPPAAQALPGRPPAPLPGLAQGQQRQERRCVAARAPDGRGWCSSLAAIAVNPTPSLRAQRSNLPLAPSVIGRVDYCAIYPSISPIFAAISRVEPPTNAVICINSCWRAKKPSRILRAGFAVRWSSRRVCVMSSLIQCLGTWLNDEEGIAVLERKLSDAKSAAAAALAKLHQAELALSQGNPGAQYHKAQADREVHNANATLSDFQTALATARATRAA